MRDAAGGAVGRLVAVAVAAALVVGCGRAGDGAAGGSAAAPGSVTGEVVVFAAASLTDVLGELGAAFERDHPGARVTLNVAGSATLAAGILEGAPADVLATANPATMDRVAAAGATAGAPRVFARNVLELAVPEGNPGGVAGLADLSRPELLVGVCAPAVPCGELAQRVVLAAGVRVDPDTEEPDVRALLAKVVAGELDAGLVYRTDVAATAGGVGAIAVPEAAAHPVDYPVAVLDGAPNRAGAAAFVDLLLGDAGRRALAGAGFLVP